jgi:hypothetical protein
MPGAEPAPARRRPAKGSPVSSFFAILLAPLNLVTRMIAASPPLALAAFTVLGIVAFVLGDKVTASCLAMVAGIVLVWYDEGRRPSIPEQGGAMAA